MVSMIYYTLTTFFAVFLGKINTFENVSLSSKMLYFSGIVLVSVIKPGKWTTTNIEDLVGHVKTTPCVATAVDTIIDLMKLV